MLSHILSPDTQAILLLCASFGQNRQAEPQPLTVKEYGSLVKWLLERNLTPASLLEPSLLESSLLESSGLEFSGLEFSGLEFSGQERREKSQLQNISIGQLNPDRLVALLERGAMLALAVENWTNKGIWVLARSDRHYPKRLKKQLQNAAPPILYGVGNIELLSKGGLAVLGSRDVDEEAIAYTEQVAETCAEEGMQVVSGGARGVDRSAMLAAVQAGGTAVGILADSLTKASVYGKYRSGIRDGQLTLVSAYDPDAGFTVGNAMGRNKYVYALADYALVVSSSLEKGGTWAGATEALQRLKDVPVFVRMQGNSPPGNRALLNLGAKPFPNLSENSSLAELLQAAWAEDAMPLISISESLRDKEVLDKEVLEIQVQDKGDRDKQILDKGDRDKQILDKGDRQIQVQDNEIQEKDAKAASAVAASRQTNKDSETEEVKASGENPEAIAAKPKNIYEAALPLILAALEQPRAFKPLARDLDVREGQLRDWLNMALEEGKVSKTKNMYVTNPPETQLSLLRPS
ncbi:MAG: DNA-processing protein DprA [Oscillatoria sp. SIO1A7]|nr:DNA-processing protein DprA [Oscillatoria sp. SIO1A7]